MTDSPDLLVIGGGTAGLSAARTARRFGRSVVMVTDGEPGGDCTFTGCVPSKTLLASGRLPFAEAISRVHATVDEIAATENSDVLRAEGIDVVVGRADARARDCVEVDGRVLTPESLVIATGSGPVIPPILGIRDVAYLTNENLFELTELPEHLLVVGGGAIGVEMAQAFIRLGSRVTILEAGARLIGKEEPEASAVVGEVLGRDGVDVYLDTTISEVARTGTVITATTSRGDIHASHLLVAAGRQARACGCDALGIVRSERGAIRVDARMRTSVAGVYAAGDVTGRLAFTHAADEMGRVAATNALRKLPLRFKEHAIPWVTFTSPEVARVGLTESQAAQHTRGARVVELPMADVDRARTSGHTDGFIKIIVGPRTILRNAGGGRVLGATIVADRAGEMIAELALAIRTTMFTGRLAQSSHAYPTWSVGVQQTVGQIFGVGDRKPRPARKEFHRA